MNASDVTGLGRSELLDRIAELEGRPKESVMANVAYEKLQQENDALHRECEGAIAERDQARAMYAETRDKLATLSAEHDGEHYELLALREKLAATMGTLTAPATLSLSANVDAALEARGVETEVKLWNFEARNVEIRSILSACEANGMRGTSVGYGFEAIYEALGKLLDERDALQRGIRTVKASYDKLVCEFNALSERARLVEDSRYGST